MKMESYETFVGFCLSEIPLSSVAQKIMSAIHSGEEVVNQTSVRTSVVLEDKKTQLMEEKRLNSCTNQTSRALIQNCPESSSIRLTDQLSVDQMQENISSMTPSSLIPQGNQKVSVLQENQQKQKHFLQRHAKNASKEKVNLKRKYIPCSNSLDKAREHTALGGDTEKAETHTGSENSRACRKHFCDIRHLDDLEKPQLIALLKQAVALVVTLMYKDGSTQLGPEQTPLSPVEGIVVFLQRQVEKGSGPLGNSALGHDLKEDSTPSDQYFYIKTGNSSLWGQEQEAYNPFARDVLLQMLISKCPVTCFNAKDFVRTVLRFLGEDSSWKCVAGFVGLDPRIAAWLMDPSDAAPTFEDLVTKYLDDSITVAVRSTYRNSSQETVSQHVCNNLRTLHRLTRHLCAQLKANGLWHLFCTLELPLIPILAVMESHSIRVNKEELERTSALLGSRLKELEQEAHFAAGERFLITSSHQLQEILFGKLQLHLLSPRESLPKSGPQGQPSTSEAVLHILQDLHPLPKIILEYRQVHKMKSTFVDGLLACMRKGSVSSTWNQTGTVTGRLSSRRPNIQGICKHPIQITKPGNVKGAKAEAITISPRSMFVSTEGHTFLAADFSQIELRILAHLSGDPELLKLFRSSERNDVFLTLTSQWKDIPAERVTHLDRERTKKVVYSAVYGAGKERLAACLEVTIQEAALFLESFLQKYKKIKDFAQATIAQCHQTGCVVSLMGRRRPLPHIHACDPLLRAQAERQAVNFVLQGSAADLCKMAMTHTFATVASSPHLTARLVAQIHDELLFEVEDTQVLEFAALLRDTMESLRHVPALDLQLLVPLNVSLSVGHSWGCLETL